MPGCGLLIHTVPIIYFRQNSYGAITDEVIQVGSRARETLRCQDARCYKLAACRHILTSLLDLAFGNLGLGLGLVFMNLRRMTLVVCCD